MFSDNVLFRLPFSKYFSWAHPRSDRDYIGLLILTRQVPQKISQIPDRTRSRHAHTPTHPPTKNQKDINILFFSPPYIFFSVTMMFSWWRFCYHRQSPDLENILKKSKGYVNAKARYYTVTAEYGDAPGPRPEARDVLKLARNGEKLSITWVIVLRSIPTLPWCRVMRPH